MVSREALNQGTGYWDLYPLQDFLNSEFCREILEFSFPHKKFLKQIFLSILPVRNSNLIHFEWMDRGTGRPQIIVNSRKNHKKSRHVNWEGDRV